MTVSIKPVSVTAISFPLFVEDVKFAKLNKQNSIEEYQEELESGKFNLERFRVSDVVVLSEADYEEFLHSFLRDYDFLSGKGGCESTADLREVDSFYEYTEEEQELYRDGSYRVGLIVSKQGSKEHVYVDPQGHDYARYVGLKHSGKPPESAPPTDLTLGLFN